MKVLFDPIYTTNSPGKCASNAKFTRIAKHLLEKYPDAYIYWPIPEETYNPADLLCYEQHPRIHYFRMSYGRDRYREYRRLYYQQEKMIAFYGEFWDWDLLITNRTTMVPFYRQLTSHHSSRIPWARRIYVLEDFPQMGFKLEAAVVDDKHQDCPVILGYYSADRTAISAYWEKQLIIERARAHFGAAVIRHLQRTISEASPVHIEKTELKSAEWLADRNKPFTIGFAGRLVTGHQLDKIFEIMRKNWVLRHDWKVQCLVSTQSHGAGRYAQTVGIPDFVRLETAGREKFHQMMRDEVHVGLFFSKEEDYSMSLLEPLILGVPYAVYKAPWSVATLGEDYPFFFKSQLEAYTIVKAFHEDYAGTYEIFAKWSKEKFEPILLKRNEVTIITELDAEIADWKKAFAAYKETLPPQTSEAVRLISEEMRGANVQMTFEEAIRRAEEKGKSRHLAQKLETDQFEFTTSFSTDRQLVRVRLMAAYGAFDSGVLPGSLAFPKEG